MQIKILGYWITIHITSNPGIVPSIRKPIQEEYFDNPCRFCNKKISPEEAYTMARYGEPHCNLAQFPEDNKIV